MLHKTTNLPSRHVHFGLSDPVPAENSVVIQEKSPGCIHIHLGFLQLQHNYMVTLDVPKVYFLGYNLSSILKAAEKGIPNINCKLILLEEKMDHFHLAVEFNARKEKLLNEELVFNVEDKSIKLVFIARVLGEGKGTPLLKNEIKCIGTDIDEMSEASDWTGFD